MANLEIHQFPCLSDNYGVLLRDADAGVVDFDGFSGIDGMIACATLPAADMVVAAIVGAIALTQLMDFKTWTAVLLISFASIITSVVGTKTSQPE